MTLHEFITFLNENSGALTVVFTAVVTLSTVVYAILTAVLVSETKKMREVQTEPKIQIQIKPLEFSINIVRLEVKNIGYGPAENVSFSCDVLSGGEDGSNLLKEFTRSNFFNSGLKYFGPNQVMYSGYTQMSKNGNKKMECSFLFKVSFKSVTGKKYKEKCLVDMSEMKGLSQLGKPNLYSIAKSLESIEKTFGYLTTGFKKLHTNIYSSRDRQKEYEEQLKMMEEYENKEKNS